jgi:hypothetical protein
MSDDGVMRVASSNRRLLLMLIAVLVVGTFVFHAFRRAPETVAPEITTSSEVAPAAESVASAPASVKEPVPDASPAAHGFTIRGRVMDAATRAAVRAFSVTLHPEQRSEKPKKSITREYYAHNGEFEWSGLELGTWNMNVRAQGYQPFNLHGIDIAAKGEPKRVEVLLRAGYTVRGRVIDEATSAGIASASIIAREVHEVRYLPDFVSRARTQADADGMFVIGGLPSGRAILEVQAPGYAHRDVFIEVTDKLSPIQIALFSGGKIAGRLTGPDGIMPVVGDVRFFSSDQGLGGSSRTDDAGAFSFEHLAPARYKLTAHAGGVLLTREIVLEKNENIVNLVLAMGVGRTIRGVVTGLSSEELRQWVQIYIQREGAIGASSAIRVDSQGAFELPGVRPGRVHVIAEQAPRVVRKTVDVTADADAMVTLEFPKGARLSGRITRGGQPLEREQVRPAPLDQSVSSFISGVNTTNDGAYVIEHLPYGEYTLYVGPHQSKPFRIGNDLQLDIDIPNTSLAGRVLESSGDIPVVGAQVQVWSDQPGLPAEMLNDATNDLGRFKMTGLENGSFVVSVFKPGYALHRDRFTYQTPSADLTLRLTRDEGVEIKVLGGEDGHPLRAVLVSESIEEGGAGMHFTLQLDEHGIGRLPGELAGSSLQIFAMDYDPTTVREWSGEPLEVRLTRGKR